MKSEGKPSQGQGRAEECGDGPPGERDWALYVCLALCRLLLVIRKGSGGLVVRSPDGGGSLADSHPGPLGLAHLA